MQFEDLTGKTFGHWTVEAYAPSRKWLCTCVCGTVREVRADHLKSGASRSCGCIGNIGRRQAHATHGKHKTPEYFAYRSLLQRCYNERNPNFKNYGARDITVCDRWRESFENFYADMGSRPSKGYSIDRIDNDGPYSPENCRWATMEQQHASRRPSTPNYLTFEGKTLMISEWARVLGIQTQSLRWRLKKYPVEVALAKSKRKGRQPVN